MQTLINRYASLILSAIYNDADSAFVTKLVAYMKQRGHTGLLSAVLRRVERLYVPRGAVVTVARADDASKYAPAIASQLVGLGSSADYTIGVDDRMVGGYMVRAGGKLVDTSYRTALVTLYKNIT
jgi:F0F1-type ATP synthase delta subunit